MTAQAPPLKITWRDRVFAHKTLGSRLKVFCLALSDDMHDDGRVSTPRVGLAAKMGVSEKTISVLYADAVQVGVLQPLEAGKKGRTATYVARIPPSEIDRPRRTNRVLIDFPAEDEVITVTHVGKERADVQRHPRAPLLSENHVGKESEQAATLTSVTHVGAASSTSATAPTSAAQTAIAGKRPSTPDTSGLSSPQSSTVPSGTPESLDGPSDGKVSPKAAPRQPQGGADAPPPEPDEIRGAHDVLAALGPERYEQALRQAAEANPDAEGPELIVAAACIVQAVA